MIKLAILIVIVIAAGCATIPSEYKQGCLDGVVMLRPFENPNMEKISEHCAAVEFRHRQRERNLERLR